MRIVSLLPAATEWVCAFGGGADLAGRSHACDHPPEVTALPVLTRPAVAAAGDSAGIDRAVRDRLAQGLSLFEVDLALLRRLQPELVLTQAQCEVCAVSQAGLEEALAAWAGGRPQVFSMEPMTLKGVLDAALGLGRAIGRLEGAMRFLGEAEAGLQALRGRLGLRRQTDPAGLPTVLCVEWLEPLMTAGHWMPEVVEMAGGRAVLAEQGARSAWVDWEEVRAADPDVIVVAPCGLTTAQTRSEMHYLTGRDGWEALTAVRRDQVYLMDGHAYFNRPGPRLYRSIELLARALYPEIEGAAPAVQPWEAVRFG